MTTAVPRTPWRSTRRPQLAFAATGRTWPAAARAAAGVRAAGRGWLSLLRASAALLLAVAAWNGGRAVWIEAKAWVAQELVRRAWEASQRADGREARPWPWADTHPVARLRVPAHGVDLFVLAGGSGSTLAFGPGHVAGTALPGLPGNAVIGGHRDTHLAFLRDLAAGDVIEVERGDGARRVYAVREARVVDRRQGWLMAETGDTRLTLVTCWPFDALRPGGPLRYVVTAVAR